MSSYKAEKEAFVSDATGSSVLHVNLICSVALAAVFLYSTIESRFLISQLSLPYAQPLTEFALLVLPLLLSMTVFAIQPIVLCLLLGLPAVLITVVKPRRPNGKPLLPPPTISSPTRLSSSRPSSPNGTSPRPLFRTPLRKPDLDGEYQPQLVEGSSISLLTGAVPYITTYRAHMIFMTVLAILAVDFPVFPRNLVKCEAFGVSLMDLGVGSFVFSQGLVSSIPILKNPNYLTAPLVPKLLNVTKKVLPLIALGLVRVVLVKGAEYPEHVSEYGVHWNFFITMALLPPLSVLLHPLIPLIPISVLALTITSVHEIALRFTSLQAWALSDIRHGLMSQNKEGITSLPGYLAIHVLGFLTGTLLLPPSPSLFRRHQRLPKETPNKPSDDEVKLRAALKKRQPVKAAIELSSYSFVWWILLGLFSLLNSQDRSSVSRRLANAPYVLWTAAFNTSFLLGYLVIDAQFFHPRSPLKFPYVVHHDTNEARSSVDNPSNNLSVPSSPVRARSFPDRGMSTATTLSLRTAKTLKRAYSSHTLDETAKQETISAPYEISDDERRAPELLEAVNLNGLVIFLLANVLTGLVNMTVPTMYTSDSSAMGVLFLYSSVICWFAWFTREKRLIKL